MPYEPFNEVDQRTSMDEYEPHKIAKMLDKFGDKVEKPHSQTTMGVQPINCKCVQTECVGSPPSSHKALPPANCGRATLSV